MTVRVTPWSDGDRGQKRHMVDVHARRADGSKVRDRKIIEGPRSTAQAWGDKRQAVLLGEIRAPEPKAGPSKAVTVKEWATKMPRYFQGGKQSATDSALGIIATHIVQHIGELRLDEVTPDVRDSLEEKWRAGGYPELKRDRIIKPTKAKKTINNRRQALLSLLLYAVECKSESGLRAMPCTIELLKVDNQKAPKFYEPDVYAKMVKAAGKMADPRALVLTLLGGECGLRVGEMMALKWSDVRWRERRLIVGESVYERTVDERFVDDVKGGKEKPIPMSPALVKALRRLEREQNGALVLHRDGRPMSWRAMAWLVMKVERASGLPMKGHVHVFRHTFCSHLAAAGVPASTIQELARHQNEATTKRYTHLMKDAREDAVKALAGWRRNAG